MGLIDLKTNLKSLKFGKDRPGGGDSGQPYIVEPIPNTLSTVSLDFPIRGGLLASIKSSTTDLKRITKFITDVPRGLVFILKQTGLQLSNPKLDVPYKGSDAGILSSGTLNIFGRSIEPTRIYNLGVNTLAQIPVAAVGIHFDRHGLSPVMSDKSKYEYIVGVKNLQSNGEENRLILLKSQLFFNSKPTNNLISGIRRIISRTSLENSDVISDYAGGPGSLYGIGRTRVKRYSYTDKTSEIRDSITNPDPKNSFLNSISFDYDLINQPRYTDKSLKAFNFVDFRKTIYEKFKRPSNSNLPEGSDYERTNLESRIGTGNPGKQTRNRSKINVNDVETHDKINMVPLTDVDFSKIKEIFPDTTARDIIKFRFEALNNDKIASINTTKILFRAYLTGITDNFNGDWNSFRYSGRGENFYTYQGFDRQFSFNFKIAAHSRAEMKPLYQKLNFLVSNTAPDYNTSNGFMRAPFMLLTMGNWLYRQPGILKSINLTIDDNTPWEIAMGEPEGLENDMNELPHVINASVSFIPIHSFIPRKGYESPVKFIHTGTDKPEGRWLEKGAVLKNKPTENVQQ